MNLSMPFRCAIIRIALFASATLVAHAGPPTIIWQTPSTGGLYWSLKFNASGSELIAGGQRLGCSSGWGTLVRRFDAFTGTPLLTTQVPCYYAEARGLALSPDQQRIIAANSSGFLQFSAATLELLPLPPNTQDPNYTVD